MMRRIISTVQVEGKRQPRWSSPLRGRPANLRERREKGAPSSPFFFLGMIGGGEGWVGCPPPVSICHHLNYLQPPRDKVPRVGTRLDGGWRREALLISYGGSGVPEFPFAAFQSGGVARNGVGTGRAVMASEGGHTQEKGGVPPLGFPRPRGGRPFPSASPTHTHAEGAIGRLDWPRR